MKAIDETCSGSAASKTSLSRPLDVHRWSDYPELNSCLTDLVDELERHEGRRRQRREEDAKRFRGAVRCLVLDLYVAWKTAPDMEVAIHLGKTRYTKRDRYRALFIRWTSFMKAFSGLKDAGYIEVTKTGSFNRDTGEGWLSRIRATDRLIALLIDTAKLTIPAIAQHTTDVECILLRDEEKRLVQYDDSYETLSMRAELQRINEHLQSHWIDIEITDAEFHTLQKRMMHDYQDKYRERPFIDFGQRSLVRIFNNRDWQQGGRFYRGWWQSVPKEYRRYITINGKQTDELDYSALHPHMLYAHVGAKLEGDAYDLGNSRIDRQLVKTTFNKMINADKRISKPDDFDEAVVGLSWSQLQSTIEEKHEPIRQYFKSGYGVRLQRQDSDIAQSVMLKFIAMGYTCLPVHDSFLVHHALRDELKDVMAMEFLRLTGQRINIKETLGIDTVIEQGIPSGEQISMDINAALAPSGKYAGYEQRLNDWRAYTYNN